MNKIKNSLWTERYRPDTLENYVGNEGIKEIFQRYIDENDIPHILLHGIQGVGKCLNLSEEVIIEIELTEKELEIYKKFQII
jgi:replication factor C small subunit